MRHLLWVLVGWLALAGRVDAQLAMLQQDRVVEAAVARATPPQPFNVHEQDQADDFGSWLSAVVARPTLLTGRIEAVSSHNSTTEAHRLQVIGAARAEGEKMEGATVLARSEYRVQFAVTEPVSFSLSGFLARGTRTSIVEVALVRSGGPEIFRFDIPGQDLELTLSEVGLLQPGVYEFLAACLIDIQIVTNAAFVRDASFVVQLNATEGAGVCEGDIDSDGDVDLADFAEFQVNFEGPQPTPGRAAPPEEE